MDLTLILTMGLMEEREVMETNMAEKAAKIQTLADLEAGGEVNLTLTLIHLEDLEAGREVSMILMATQPDLAAEREVSSQEVEELCP